MKKIAFILVAAPLLWGCSTKPYTGETTTNSVTPSGVAVTKYESRSMLPGRTLAGTDSEMRRVSAVVTGIDRTTRQITMRTADGKTATIVAGDEVRNFAQLKIGDRVGIEYLTTMSFAVRPPTDEEMTRAQNTTAILGRAPLGSKPAGLVGIGDVGVFFVDDVNKSAGTVTLMSANGSFVFKSKHPENLDYVHRGDNVVVEVAEVFAAKVTPQS